MREMNAYQSLQLSGSALRHWYELDPAGARPAIIREIMRPRPRFDARTLGILPNKTLPEVDFALAEHLAASTDAEGLVNISSLIARYASDTIFAQVTAKLDPLLGKWGCDIQDPLLAYVLRVNPEGARVRIEAAIAARGEGYTACNRFSFQGISEIYYHPVLEEIGIHSLDDPDPQVAETAATMLGKYGSPAVKAALLLRFKEWSARWAGQESELNLTFSEQSSDRAYELGLGENLAQALATGTSHLSQYSWLGCCWRENFGVKLTGLRSSKVPKLHVRRRCFRFRGGDKFSGFRVPNEASCSRHWKRGRHSESGAFMWQRASSVSVLFW
jgi:hypothetical protein